MSTQGEKFRAVFFAALMVVSMLAFTTAFAGSAVAASGNNAPGNTGVQFAGDFTEDTAEDTFESPRSAAFNQTIDVSIEVENPTSDTSTATVEYYVNDAAPVTDGEVVTDVDGDAANQSVTLGPNETTTVAFTINTGAQEFQNAGANGTAAQDVEHGFSVNPTVSQSLTVGTESSGRVTVDVIASDTLEGEPGIDVSLYDADNFDTIANPNTPLLDEAVTNSNGRVQFTDLAVGAGSGSPERYVAVVNDSDFTSGTTTTELFETAQTEDAGTITLDRIVNADGISIDKTPASGEVPLDGTITDEVTVTTDDTPNGSAEPLDNTPVDVSIIDSNTNEFGTAVVDGDLEYTPTPSAETGSDGTVEFDIELDQASINPDEIDGQVTFTLEFEATESGDGEPAVTQTQEITFVGEPPSGDGTISGDVEEIVIDGESNTQDAEGVGVHAVRTSRVNANTYPVDGFAPTSTPGEGSDYGNFYRVAALDAPGGDVTEILDVRTDYLVRPDLGNAYSQNLSIQGGGTGFSSESPNPAVAPLEPGNYSIQYSPDGNFSAPTNYTSDTFEVSENLTYEATEDRFEDSPAEPTDVTQSDGTYELYNLFTNGNDGESYVVIAADDTPNLGFANFRGYTQGVVFENSDDFSGDVQQLETDLTVFDVDVRPDEINAENVGQLESADDATANYTEVLDTEDPNTIERNGRSVDVIEVTTAGEGSPIGAEATISISSAPSAFDGEFLNTAVEGNVVAHSSDQITIDTSPSTEGTAVVFLESDQNASDAFVQLDAELDNGLDADVIGSDEVDPTGDDRTGKLFIGVTEYDSGSIKGDIARDDDALTDTFVWTREIEDASGNEITIEPHVSDIASTPNSTSFGGLQDNDDVRELNFTVSFNDSSTSAAVDESFVATGAELREIDLAEEVGPVDSPDVSSFNLLRFANPITADNPGQYSMDRVPAQDGGVEYALIEARQYDTGERGTTDAIGGRSVTPGLTRNADITIPGAVVEATYELSNLDPSDATVTEGDDPINVSVDVDNTGIDSGEQDVTLEVTNASGAVVYDDTIADVVVGPQETQTVTFTDVPAGALSAGEYNHAVSSDDDSIEGNLTVEVAENGGDLSEQELRDAYGNEVDGAIETTGLVTGISDWRNDDISTPDLIQLIDLWRSGQ